VTDGTPSSSAVATITRMRLRHWWYIVPTIRRFRELYGHTARDPAFIRGHFSVVDPWTIMNFSIWTNRRAMLLWSGASQHVQYVRWAQRHCRELWSSEWHLAAVSRGARRWSGAFPISTVRYTDDIEQGRPSGG